MRKIILSVLAFVFLTSSCTSVKTQKTTNATGNFTVDILDVGKADAMILKSENHAVVIDCGEKGDGKEILECLEENDISYLDYMFITHFDKDHVGGASKIINNIEIGEIITPDYVGSNTEYEKFIEAAGECEVEVNAVKEEMSFTLDDCDFYVYPPEKTQYDEDDNDFSLVISVIHGENSFLFAGDAEEERLSELFGQIDLKHDFLKVPHHGRYNDNTKKFFKAVKPKYAAITCSEKNPAAEETLEILKHLKTEVYQAQDGNINVLSDGKNITINQ